MSLRSPLQQKEDSFRFHCMFFTSSYYSVEAKAESNGSPRVDNHFRASITGASSSGAKHKDPPRTGYPQPENYGPAGVVRCPLRTCVLYARSTGHARRRRWSLPLWDTVPDPHLLDVAGQQAVCLSQQSKCSSQDKQTYIQGTGV